jgi:hypothetical protein
MEKRKIRAATARSIRMFWLRPFIIFYICITIFLLVILVDKSIFRLGISVKDWVWVNPDLDNIPRRTESLLGKPKTGKFENDITSLLRLDRVSKSILLLCIEDLGNLDTLGLSS